MNSGTGHQNNTIYYGVYTPSDSREHDESSSVFEDKLEALKVAKKNKKSRFKAFQFYHEAVDFALNGSEFPNNNTTKNNSLSSETSNSVGEKASPFKGPKPQELTELRKSIENGNIKLVKDTIWQNPRYLVSSGDTPAILQEGPRYNALHVAAKSRNAEITELILNTISNPEFIKLLYGDDNQQNAEERAAVLIDLYLNTPNKGLNETPLHFASKHGAPDVVEILVSYPQCDKTLKNRFQKTAAEIICDRAEGENLAAAKKAIELLLHDSYYVPVLRAEDNSLAPLIGEPFTPSTPPNINSDPLSPRLEIHAYAGPMDKKEAQLFRRTWKTPPRSLSFSVNHGKNLDINLASLKFKDTKKGLERIGKKLAKTYDVNWKEYWPFLDCFIDISSEEGLNALEAYLAERFTILNVSVVDELKKSSSELNGIDALSPISNLCAALSACRLNDSMQSINCTNTRKVDSGSIMYIDKACQVFANRISNDILHILCSEDNIVQVLETEIKQLELLVTSCMDDDRFLSINFQKIHSRLGVLIGQKLYNNLKENVRSFLCVKLENMLDNLTKSIDCFSSDDESHNLDIAETKKPTIYQRQLICLMHYILHFLSQNYESKQAVDDGGNLKDWDTAEACTCVYHSRKSKRNNVSRSNSFKNGANVFGGATLDSARKKMSFSDDTEPNCVQNDLCMSRLSNHVDLSSDDSDSEDDEQFYTPPSSPSLLQTEFDSDDEFMDSQLPKYDIFIQDEHPTKIDCQVYNALTYHEVQLDKNKYPNIYRWYHTISLFSREERESWTPLKPQKQAKNLHNMNLNYSFDIDPSKASTPSPNNLSRSWSRITGTNSPSASFESRRLLF